MHSSDAPAAARVLIAVCGGARARSLISAFELSRLGRLEYGLDFDGEPKREGGDPNGGSRWSADHIAKGVYQEVSGAVGDQVLLGKSWRGADEHYDLDEARNLRKRAELRTDRRQEVEHHRLRGQPPILRGQILAETPGMHGCVTVEGSVSGQEQQGVRAAIT